MRISRIKVNNFKSLVDFDLPMEKFTCLIGLNGSGKSTVLQFLDFLGQQMWGGFEDWYKARGWVSVNLCSHFVDSLLVEFRVDLSTETDQHFGFWSGTFDLIKSRCVREEIRLGPDFITVEDGRYRTVGLDGFVPVQFKYSGSILSQLLDEQLAPNLRRFRKFVTSFHSLDTLSINLIREPSLFAGGTLGHGGRDLAAYIAEMSSQDRDRLSADLRTVYPWVQGVVEASSPDSHEKGRSFEYIDAIPPPDRPTLRRLIPPSQISDGVLRLTVFLAELTTQHEFILLDEIENGINPEIVEFLVDKLVNARQQVMVTTHSPMILNYLEDEVAKKSVVYLYKTDAGHTKAIRFFDIPSLAKKLEVLGPGEVFVDTKLSALADEIAALTKAGAP